MASDHFLVRSIRAHVRPLPRELPDHVILDISSPIGDVNVRYVQRKTEYAITVQATGRQPALGPSDHAWAAARLLGELRYAFFPHLLNETSRLLTERAARHAFTPRVILQLSDPYVPVGRWTRCTGNDEASIAARYIVRKNDAHLTWHQFVATGDDIRSIIETYTDVYGAANFAHLGKNRFDGIAESGKSSR